MTDLIGDSLIPELSDNLVNLPDFRIDKAKVGPVERKLLEGKHPHIRPVQAMAPESVIFYSDYFIL